MKVLIAGGTGFIGKAMLRAWASEHELAVLTRNPARAQPSLPAGARAVGWDGATLGEWTQSLEGADLLINLAGEPIAQRWTCLLYTSPSPRD
ncbi:MAG: NAD-dependent epimerase/dehydratase family protein, partial [Fimbriimonadales bacterium]|nr:NAD-dependent epimerase/dehydratase family protein [Fimbriimonadales bacterium]